MAESGTPRPAPDDSVTRRGVLGLVTGSGLAAGSRLVTGAGLLAGGGLVSGCSGGTAPRDRVVIASGATQGVYYRYAQVLRSEAARRLSGLRVENATSNGSVDNLRRLTGHRATLAFSAADAANDAYLARPGSPLRALAVLYDDYFHLVVRADSPVGELKQLRGLRVSLGAQGSGTVLIATRLLSVAGLPTSAITVVPLGLDESVAALRAGAIDAFFWSGGLPTPGIADLAARLPIRIVSLQDLGTAMRSRYGMAYRTATIQEGVYPTIPSVPTLAIPDLLLTTAQTRDGVVRGFTRLLFAANAQISRQVPEAAALDPLSAVFTQPIPLHPAATAYYRGTRS